MCADVRRKIMRIGHTNAKMDFNAEIDTVLEPLSFVRITSHALYATYL